MRSLSKLLLINFTLLILFLLLIGDTTEANAQQLRDTFRRVKQAVVIVRTQEKTVAPLLRQGLTSSDGLASGVLISDDGKVLTAAHVVQAVDKVFVEFADGYLVTARVISSAPKSRLASMSAAAWEFFQTDAAINGGNSGSPMFNWKGEVIGIVSNILSRSGGFEGIGFAATS